MKELLTFITKLTKAEIRASNDQDGDLQLRITPRVSSPNQFCDQFRFQLVQYI